MSIKDRILKKKPLPVIETDPAHDELVKRAIRWLRIVGCRAVAAEFPMYGGEIPDAIGWQGTGWSIMVECKVSRADFHADKRKRWRREGRGVGQERWYLCPPGILHVEDVEPLGWGLLYCLPNGLRKVHVPAKSAVVKRSRERRTFDEKIRRREIRGLVALVRRAQIKGFDWRWGPNNSIIP
jgi:hypothetical protein